MKNETKTKIIKLLIILGALVLIFLAVFLPLFLTGMLDKISNAQQLQQFILSGGVWSYLIFFVIQFLQVTLLPIPAAVTTVAGTLVFGPWITCAISFAAVLFGSVFAFFLGRKVGKRLVVWVAGEKDYEKWAEKLEKGKFVFFLMMLLPVFPDDILCMIVGTTKMSWRFFITTNLITRPIGIVSTCFLGSGIIPFEGWYLLIWGFLFIACAILFVLSYKYQPQIEGFILKFARKFEKKNVDECENESQNTVDKNDEKEVESSEILIEKSQNVSDDEE